MFNISKEMIIILVIVLVIFGPKQLPQLGKMLGKTMKDLRAGMDDAEDEHSHEGHAEELAGGEHHVSLLAVVMSRAVVGRARAHPTQADSDPQRSEEGGGGVRRRGVVAVAAQRPRHGVGVTDVDLQECRGHRRGGRGLLFA